MEKYFMIFNVSEINSIDYSQLLTTPPEALESVGGTTLRFSVDGTKTFVKYEGIEIPTCLVGLTTKEGPYNYEQMLSIIQSSEWTIPYSGVS